MSIWVSNNGGTIKFTNGSDVIQGIGTLFEAFRPGGRVELGSGLGLQIKEITSNTAMKATIQWTGATTAFVPYSYSPRNEAGVLSDALNALLNLLAGNNLQSLAGLSMAAGDFAYATGPGVFNKTGSSANGRAMLGAADYAAMRNLLGLATNPSFGGVVNLAGGRLAFPSTQVPSSDPNVLDDYEEGTWLPTISFGGASAGVAYLVQQGVYFKVGRMMLAAWFLQLSAKGSSVGACRIGGLPFTVADWVNGGGLGFYSGFASLGGPPIVQAEASSTDIRLWNPGAAAVASVLNTNVTNDGYLYGVINYRSLT